MGDSADLKWKDGGGTATPDTLHEIAIRAERHLTNQALDVRSPSSQLLVGERLSGVARITAERERQIEVEGFDVEHDAETSVGDMIDAARCYLLAAHWAEGTGQALPASLRDSACYWPWAEAWWKPSTDPVRNLEKAGALTAAVMDKILRGRGEL